MVQPILPILHEQVGGVIIVSLNRAEKRNALSREMIEQLSSLFSRLENDSDLRAVILTGTGDQAFCAGTDIVELLAMSQIEAHNTSERGQKLCAQIESFPVPVIAAINGIAVGGGCELALACHLRIASSNAAFSLPETKLGLIPAYGGTQRLSREVGLGLALEMMLSGRTLTAEQALDFGLVNRLVTPSDLLSDAISLARQMEQLSPLSIRACLRAVIRGLELPLAEGLALESELFAALFATQDAREGTTAFLEKRPPVFKGK
jgi:enoyl-CoA hydratase